ncbi:phage tail sheath subtilisin-like domain-containing protein [Anaerovorax odorimutans]|uniref:Phage tail sheath subtilisin-like domain-containing protein n=1 Tax=Anaerovorax odorimutans TaxID=109327 RepID=A0ABT1RR47_9FIRM|nr:phage tail sheath subtilisin-like domain-containing protein [Anaerovorax odorimutans]MCQ4637672.1 phage tail sheath subtilisin-like domain-containing protein [Anaerovorax odorimutans]
MGMPTVNIVFIEKAKTVLKRSERGVVGLIIKGAVPANNPVVVTGSEGIPTNFSADNKAEIERALIGNVTPPRKIIIYCLPAAAEDLTAALDYFENTKVNYLAVPAVTEDEMTSVEEWVDKVRANGRTIKVVLPNYEADNEAIINFATNTVATEAGNLTAAQFCGRVAGICAGTPLTQAITYAKIPEATDCERLTKSEMDQAVDAGKLIVFNDGEKVKIARGVNSLQTITEKKGEQFKKIKILDVMDTMKGDITTCVQDEYIGKYTNSYDHKCLLVSSIGRYLDTLVNDQVLQYADVEIDVNAVKTYLDKQEIDTSDMTYEDLKQADTGEKVFLVIRAKILDAIEDIDINIEI